MKRFYFVFIIGKMEMTLERHAVHKSSSQDHSLSRIKAYFKVFIIFFVIVNFTGGDHILFCQILRW